MRYVYIHTPQVGVCVCVIFECFFLSAASPRRTCMKHMISVRRLANPHRARSHLPHDIWSSVECFVR